MKNELLAIEQSQVRDLNNKNMPAPCFKQESDFDLPIIKNQLTLINHDDDSDYFLSESEDSSNEEGRLTNNEHYDEKIFTADRHSYLSSKLGKKALEKDVNLITKTKKIDSTEFSSPSKYHKKIGSIKRSDISSIKSEPNINTKIHDIDLNTDNKRKQNTQEKIDQISSNSSKAVNLKNPNLTNHSIKSQNMIHRDLKIKITRKKDLEKRKLKKTNENSIHQKSKVIKSLKGSNTSQNLQMDLSITHENRISCDEVFYNFYNTTSSNFINQSCLNNKNQNIFEQNLKTNDLCHSATTNNYYNIPQCSSNFPLNNTVFQNNNPYLNSFNNANNIHSLHMPYNNNSNLNTSNISSAIFNDQANLNHSISYNYSSNNADNNSTEDVNATPFSINGSKNPNSYDFCNTVTLNYETSKSDILHLSYENQHNLIQNSLLNNFTGNALGFNNLAKELYNTTSQNSSNEISLSINGFNSSYLSTNSNSPSTNSIASLSSTSSHVSPPANESPPSLPLLSISSSYLPQSQSEQIPSSIKFYSISL